MFGPASLTVSAGSTVTWTNKDDEPHTVVSDTALFRSGALDTDESFRSDSTNPAPITMRARSPAHGRNDCRPPMKRVTRVAFGLAGAVAAAGLGLGVFIGSGIYNIGADDHHTG